MKKCSRLLTVLLSSLFTVQVFATDFLEDFETYFDPGALTSVGSRDTHMDSSIWYAEGNSNYSRISSNSTTANDCLLLSCGTSSNQSASIRTVDDECGFDSVVSSVYSVDVYDADVSGSDAKVYYGVLGDSNGSYYASSYAFVFEFGSSSFSVKYKDNDYSNSFSGNVLWSGNYSGTITNIEIILNQEDYVVNVEGIGAVSNESGCSYGQHGMNAFSSGHLYIGMQQFTSVSNPFTVTVDDIEFHSERKGVIKDDFETYHDPGALTTVGSRDTHLDSTAWIAGGNSNWSSVTDNTGNNYLHMSCGTSTWQTASLVSYEGGLGNKPQDWKYDGRIYSVDILDYDLSGNALIRVGMIQDGKTNYWGSAKAFVFEFSSSSFNLKYKDDDYSNSHSGHSLWSGNYTSTGGITSIEIVLLKNYYEVTVTGMDTVSSETGASYGELTMEATETGRFAIDMLQQSTASNPFTIDIDNIVVQPYQRTLFCDDFETYVESGLLTGQSKNTHLDPDIWDAGGNSNWSSVTNNYLATNDYLHMVCGTGANQYARFYSDQTDLGFEQDSADANDLGKAYSIDVLDYDINQNNCVLRFGLISSGDTSYYGSSHAIVFEITNNFFNLKYKDSDYSSSNGGHSLWSGNYTGDFEGYELILSDTSYQLNITGDVYFYNQNGASSGIHDLTPMSTGRIYLELQQASTPSNPFTADLDNIKVRQLTPVECFVIDDFENSPLLPVHTGQVADWTIYDKGDPNQHISGKLVVDPNYVSENKILRAGIDISNGWCRFGRTIELCQVEAIKVRARTDNADGMILVCSLWGALSNIDIGGDCGGAYWEKSFSVSTDYSETILDLEAFQQKSGDDIDISHADIKALVFVASGSQQGNVDIAEVSLIIDEKEQFRRSKERLLKENEYRHYDLDVLDVRDFYITNLRNDCNDIDLDLASASDLSDIAAIESDFEAAAERIDVLREVYIMQRRVTAISDWCELLDNSTYHSQVSSLQSQIDIIRTSTAYPAASGYSQLDSDVSSLWEDVWSDICIQGVSWSINSNKRIVREDDKGITLYGANDMQVIYCGIDEDLWLAKPVKADYARMAELGLNAVRLPVRHEYLQQQEGVYNQNYIDYVQDCIEWAAEYGIYCIIDLHFPHPQWLEDGPTGYETLTDKSARQNVYAFLDNLKNMHEKLTTEFGDFPNVIGQEVPVNEPTLKGCDANYTPDSGYGILDRTIYTFPWLQENWNEFLEDKYGTITALSAAWSPDFTGDSNETGLGTSETWVNNSILPPGASGETKEYSTRFYDFLLWACSLHAETSKELALAIKTVKSDMLVFQQQMIAGQYSNDPIPISFTKLHQYYYDGGVDGLAAHYGMGWASKSLSATDLYWYMGEDIQYQYRFDSTSERNGGIIYWAYSSVPDERENFRCLEADGRLKADRRYLELDADYYKTAHLYSCVEPDIAIVFNSRLAATDDENFGEIEAILENLELEFDLLGSMFVAQRPEVLDNYDAVFIMTDYIDPLLLEAVGLAKDTSVLISGQFEKDINAQSVSRDVDPILSHSFNVSLSQLNDCQGLTVVRNAVFNPDNLSSEDSGDISLVSSIISGSYSKAFDRLDEDFEYRFDPGVDAKTSDSHLSPSLWKLNGSYNYSSVTINGSSNDYLQMICGSGTGQTARIYTSDASFGFVKQQTDFVGQRYSVDILDYDISGDAIIRVGVIEEGTYSYWDSTQGVVVEFDADSFVLKYKDNDYDNSHSGHSLWSGSYASVNHITNITIIFTDDYYYVDLDGIGTISNESGQSAGSHNLTGFSAGHFIIDMQQNNSASNPFTIDIDNIELEPVADADFYDDFEIYVASGVVTGTSKNTHLDSDIWGVSGNSNWSAVTNNGTLNEDYLEMICGTSTSQYARFHSLSSDLGFEQDPNDPNDSGRRYSIDINGYTINQYGCYFRFGVIESDQVSYYSSDHAFIVEFDSGNFVVKYKDSDYSNSHSGNILWSGTYSGVIEHINIDLDDYAYSIAFSGPTSVSTSTGASSGSHGMAAMEFGRVSACLQQASSTPSNPFNINIGKIESEKLFN